MYNVVEDINIYVSSLRLGRKNIYDNRINEYSNNMEQLFVLINKNRFISNENVLNLLDKYRENEILFLEEIQVIVNELRKKIYNEMRKVIDSYEIIN